MQPAAAIARPLALLAMLSAAHAFVPLPLITGSRRALPASQPQARRALAAPAGLRMQSQDNGEDGLDRFVACLPYALPLADSFEWGHYIFDAFPLAALPFLPLFPVIQLLNMPFVSFGLFIVLFNFVARNPQFSRLVRFNTLQVTPFLPAVCGLDALTITHRTPCALRVLREMKVVDMAVVVFASLAGGIPGCNPHLPAASALNCGPQQSVHPARSGGDRRQHGLLCNPAFGDLLGVQQYQWQDTE
jgi:hypothetical protein